MVFYVQPNFQNTIMEEMLAKNGQVLLHNCTENLLNVFVVVVCFVFCFVLFLYIFNTVFIQNNIINIHSHTETIRFYEMRGSRVKAEIWHSKCRRYIEGGKEEEKRRVLEHKKDKREREGERGREGGREGGREREREREREGNQQQYKVR